MDFLSSGVKGLNNKLQKLVRSKFVWPVLGSVRTTKTRRNRSGPSYDHCTLRESPGFSLEVRVSGYMNSLQGGHLSKADSSFGPEGCPL